MHVEYFAVYFKYVCCICNLNCILNLDGFSRFCRARGRESLYFTMDRIFSPSKLFRRMGNLNPLIQYMVS